jgi:hypothetical protein
MLRKEQDRRPDVNNGKRIWRQVSRREMNEGKKDRGGKR